MIERTPLQPQREPPPEAPLQQPLREMPAKEAPRPIAAEENSPHIRRLRIYSHSPLFYWWSVWVTGYIMAVLTYAFGDKYLIGQTQTWIHSSSNLGLIFFFVLF